MVRSRLDKRLRLHELSDYADYLNLLGKRGLGDENEIRIAVDLLTTNETYFFREPKHFDFLRTAVEKNGRSASQLRIWSAASSSGEEAYSIAMLLADMLGQNWEIIGTDISGRILEKARRGVYPIDGLQKIPQSYLKRYCLKGRDEFDGWFMIDSALRRRVAFRHLNLLETLPDLGMFDVIFLRNVLIYFDLPTKQGVIKRIQSKLKPGGYLIISHSESLNGMDTSLRLVTPSIYQLPAIGGGA